ncbi:FHA domain-containing protein [Microbacterium halophytorum]|uniref:hypothetical protein n=1 Tax=Microbacterium halophytorum TaxID=2067568 RepID=UPI000CFBAFBB|nr:hypothetical protein [Microbacterium halophytorum]
MSKQMTAPQTTTTHGPWGSGNPHLSIRRSDHRMDFALVSGTVRLGAAPDMELIVPGAEPHHATIVHNEYDEFVLTMHGEGEMNAAPENPNERTETLRSGARFTIGGWEFVFWRAEASDHGRPYGGRNGGEGAHEHGQNPRPDYHREALRDAEAAVRHTRSTILVEHPELGGR